MVQIRMAGGVVLIVLLSHLSQLVSGISFPSQIPLPGYFNQYFPASSMASVEYKLPQLPYGYDALEPQISKQIMELHHGKHHNTYVTNLNAALGSLAQAVGSNDIRAQLGLQQNIKFNAGGHINHSLFWENLAPAGSGLSDAAGAAPHLSKLIQVTYGGVPEFKAKFEKALLGIQGSGWGWLVVDADTKALAIVTTKDQDTVPAGKKPLFGVDMWEHAYYLQYLNGKPAYVKAIWKVLNWKTAEERFNSAEWWSTWQPLLSKL